MAKHTTVLTTTDTAGRASDLARAVVEARAAACAQIEGPVRSVYWWEGAVQEEQEWRVLFKLPASKYDDLEALIRRTRPARTRARKPRHRAHLPALAPAERRARMPRSRDTQGDREHGRVGTRRGRAGGRLARCPLPAQGTGPRLGRAASRRRGARTRAAGTDLALWRRLTPSGLPRWADDPAGRGQEDHL
jgi:periplasmic divalent cation tolerance protein